MDAAARWRGFDTVLAACIAALANTVDPYPLTGAGARRRGFGWYACGTNGLGKNSWAGRLARRSVLHTRQHNATRGRRAYRAGDEQTDAGGPTGVRAAAHRTPNGRTETAPTHSCPSFAFRCTTRIGTGTAAATHGRRSCRSVIGPVVSARPRGGWNAAITVGAKYSDPRSSNIHLECAHHHHDHHLTHGRAHIHRGIAPALLRHEAQRTAVALMARIAADTAPHSRRCMRPRGKIDRAIVHLAPSTSVVTLANARHLACRSASYAPSIGSTGAGQWRPT